MYPKLFEIGNFTVTTFGLMMFLSFIGGAWMMGKGMKRYGFNPDLAWDMLAWIAIGGILGAKLYHLALNLDAVAADPMRQIFNRGGLVWYGGLIGGVTAYYLQIRKRKLPLAVMYDATAPALFFAYAIGRVGCFLVGDDYGRTTTGWWGVAFPEGTPPTTAFWLRNEFHESIPASIPDTAVLKVHPTQLYETILALLLCALLWQIGKRVRLRPGQLFAIWMALYAVERFIIEFVRAKSDRFVAGLTTSQVMSILLVIAAVVLWQRQRNKPVWTPEMVPAEARPGAKPKAPAAVRKPRTS